MCASSSYSAHLFGSQARGDFDARSDRDILVLYSEKYPEQLQFENANVASYKLDHFLRLAERGSLFCKHIITESRFLIGNSKHIILANKVFRPKEDYTVDAMDGLTLLKCISRPVSNNNALLYGDIISVCIRNYVIQMAASSGRYIFSLSDLVEFSQRELGIPSHILIESRKLKERYRARDCARDGDVSLISEMRDRVINALDYPLDPIPTSHPIRRISDGYIQLREFEAWYISNSGSIPDIDEEFAKEILKIARSPSNYRFVIRNNIAQLIEVFVQRQAA